MRAQLTVAAAALALAATPPAPAVPPPFVPVFTTDFADPFVLPDGGRYIAYATNATRLRANVQLATSPDLVHWTLLSDGRRLRDALPVLPGWARPGYTWAPEVVRVEERYLLYFTARDRARDLQCVGVASATDPLGPFTPIGEAPLVCQPELGGTIDPSVFRDRDGTLTLLYKSDGNNPRVLKPATIYAQRLSPDGLSLAGAARPLITNDQQWEWRVVESPSLIRNAAGSYTLLFSGNHYGWEADQRLSNYGIGYATCASPLGPCTKAAANPILRSYYTAREGCLSGPGHQTVFEDRGRAFLVFHAWSATNMCRPAGHGRFMYVAPLGWAGATPVIAPSLRPRGP